MSSASSAQGQRRDIALLCWITSFSQTLFISTILMPKQNFQLFSGNSGFKYLTCQPPTCLLCTGMKSFIAATCENGLCRLRGPTPKLPSSPLTSPSSIYIFLDVNPALTQPCLCWTPASILFLPPLLASFFIRTTSIPTSVCHCCRFGGQALLIL